MGLKNDVELQLINFQKAYNSLDASAEDYDTQLANLQNEYNLNLDANQMANNKGIDPLSLDDAGSVRKRMLLNAKRDRKYARQGKWGNAASDIVKEGLSQIGNLFNTLSQPDPNSQSAAALSEQIDRNTKINAEQFDQKQAAWEEQLSKAEQTLRGPQTNATWEQQNLLAQEAMKGPLKKTIPGNGQISAPNQFGKQGMKIEYMNLFK